MLLSLFIEDSGRCFLCDLCANRIFRSMSVSLCPDFCLSSNVCMVTFLTGVVCSTFPKGSAPSGELVLDGGFL